MKRKRNTDQVLHCYTSSSMPQLWAYSGAGQVRGSDWGRWAVTVLHRRTQGLLAARIRVGRVTPSRAESDSRAGYSAKKS